MNRNTTESLSLLLLFIAISILLFFVFAPFFSVLSLAVVFAILLHWPYERLVRILGGWRSMAALLIVILMLIFIIVPLFFLGLQVSQEAQNIYAGMHGNGGQYVDAIQSAIENPIRHFFPTFTFNVDTYVESALGFVSGNLAAFIYQTLHIFFDTFLMLLTLFFFLRDGRKLLASFVRTSPFAEKVTGGILDKTYQTIRSVVRGTLYVILIRWVCIGLGFYFFGIPNAILWGSVGGIVGAVPGVGTAIAFISGIAYLYLGGHVLSAVGLALFGIGTAILVDNILTSYFFGKGLEVSPIFVLFSILGGFIFFGPVGFILGPLVLSLFLAVVRMYGLIEHERTVSPQ